MWRKNYGTINKFLLTPLREGRLIYARYSSAGQNISTHAPAGGATRSTDAPSSGLRIFLLTPLREGRLFPTSANTAAEVFLLTPLREGRPRLASNGRFCAAISTHAPAGGATGGKRMQLLRGRISTHAPAGGATWFPVVASSTFSFLLTPLREGRRTAPSLFRSPPLISTHAPAGGATGLPPHPRDHHRRFLLTPLREGRREAGAVGAQLRFDFYSRPCGRGDMAMYLLP